MSKTRHRGTRSPRHDKLESQHSVPMNNGDHVNDVVKLPRPCSAENLTPTLPVVVSHKSGDVDSWLADWWVEVETRRRKAIKCCRDDEILRSLWCVIEFCREHAATVRQAAAVGVEKSLWAPPAVHFQRFERDWRQRGRTGDERRDTTGTDDGDCATNNENTVPIPTENNRIGFRTSTKDKTRLALKTNSSPETDTTRRDFERNDDQRRDTTGTGRVEEDTTNNENTGSKPTESNRTGLRTPMNDNTRLVSTANSTPETDQTRRGGGTLNSDQRRDTTGADEGEQDTTERLKPTKSDWTSRLRLATNDGNGIRRSNSTSGETVPTSARPTTARRRRRSQIPTRIDRLHPTSTNHVDTCRQNRHFLYAIFYRLRHLP